MLGLSKSFVIFLLLAAIIGYGTKNWLNGLIVIGIYAILKIGWKLLTD